jgi:hypothetical protein
VSNRASTTIAFCPNVLSGSLEGNVAAAARGDATENLIQRGLISVSDQTASQVFL